MAAPERREIQELVTLYRLEPDLRDVFVEGSTDVSLIEWFLHETGARDVAVWEVDEVDIPAELLHELGLENGRRGRVIALADRLERELGREVMSPSCIVDADFDRVLQKSYPYAILLLTDYTCLEAYLFASRPVAKFLKLVVRRFPKAAEIVLREISPPLVELFAIRFANHRLGWNLKLIDFDRCCELGQGGVRLDSEEYITRLLNANSRAIERPQFMAEIGRLRRLLADGPRHYVHGHDLINMLAWYLRQHRSSARIPPQMVERSIYACADVGDLAAEPMFRTLLARVRRDAH